MLEMNTLIYFLLDKYTLILIVNAAVSYCMIKYINYVGQLEKLVEEYGLTGKDRKELGPDFFDNFFAIVAFIIWFDPIKIFNKDKTIASVEYNIQEGQRAYLRKIEFEGLPLEYEQKILDGMMSKVNEPFNPIKMPDDIKFAASYLQEQGHYYAVS